jgi:hypothetical protein
LFVETLKFHRWKLLLLGGLVFVAFTTAIFLFVKPQSVVRSALQAGSISVGGKDDYLEAPDLIGRRITAIYIPATLIEMSQQGVSSNVLTKLEPVVVEIVGGTVALRSTIQRGYEIQTKEFHQRILDRTIAEAKWHAEIARENLSQRIASATESIQILSEQIARNAKFIDELKTVSDGLRGSDDARRQTEADPDNPSRSSAPESLDRQLPSGQTSTLILLHDVAGERSDLARDARIARTQREASQTSLDQAKLTLRTIRETQIALRPEQVPIEIGSSRSSLTFLAALISVLLTLSVAVVLHSVVPKS